VSSAHPNAAGGSPAMLAEKRWPRTLLVPEARGGASAQFEVYRSANNLWGVHLRFVSALRATCRSHQALTARAGGGQKAVSCEARLGQ
jgi:hypothetical protein